ncbi:7157_t:CDS:1, partial [Acaulospora morrowiae]
TFVVIESNLAILQRVSIVSIAVRYIILGTGLSLLIYPSIAPFQSS